MIEHIAHFFYQAGIPFNTCRLDKFKKMIETIGRYDRGLKYPSYSEL